MTIEKFRVCDDQDRLLKEGFVQNGKESGTWYSYHDDGRIESIKIYKDGLKSGTWKINTADGLSTTEIEYQQGSQLLQRSYSKEGTLLSESRFLDDKLHNIINYYSSGSVESTYFYEGTLPHGENESFWEDGTIRSIVRFNKGKPGKTENYYSNGNMKDSTEWEGNLSTYCKYYENGQLNSESGLKGRRPHGFWREYLEDGQLLSEGNYISGQKVGEHTWYYENGNPRMIIPYNSSSKQGKEIHYFPNGKEMKIQTYLHDRLDGEWKEYTEDGLLAIFRIYKKGKMVKDCLEK